MHLESPGRRLASGRAGSSFSKDVSQKSVVLLFRAGFLGWLHSQAAGTILVGVIWPGRAPGFYPPSAVLRVERAHLVPLAAQGKAEEELSSGQRGPSMHAWNGGVRSGR